MLSIEKNGKAEREIRRRIVGEFLRKERQKAGLTQQAVAKAFSYATAQFISNWERGLSLPPLNAIARLCELYAISASSMVEVLYRYEQDLLKVQRAQLIELLSKDSAVRAKRRSKR